MNWKMLPSLVLSLVWLVGVSLMILGFITFTAEHWAEVQEAWNTTPLWLKSFLAGLLLIIVSNSLLHEKG
jgi:hypothetical protein